MREAPPAGRQKIPAKIKFVTTNVLGDPDWGTTPVLPDRRAAPSMAALQKAAGSPRAQEVFSHAVAISTGGAPVFLVAEEEKPVPF